MPSYPARPMPSSPPWGPWWLDCLSNQTHQLDQWSNHPSQGPTPGHHIVVVADCWRLTAWCNGSYINQGWEDIPVIFMILRFNVFIHKRALRKFHVREGQLYNYVISIILVSKRMIEHRVGWALECGHFRRWCAATCCYTSVMPLIRLASFYVCRQTSMLITMVTLFSKSHSFFGRFCQVR